MDFAVVEGNLRHMMRCFASASDAGELRDEPGLSIASSGMDYGVFNSVMLSTCVTGGAPELDRLIAIPETHFRARGLHWSLWLCEDLIALPFRRKAREHLFERGFRMLSDPPGLLAERLLPPIHTLPCIEIRSVDGVAARCDFAYIMALAFEFPFVASRDIYAGAGPWECGLTGYVGYREGRPIAAAAVIIAGGAVGVYSVGTLPEFRGKGYAEVLIRHAVAVASASSGIERTVLQSTPSGLSLYQRMGYRRVTRFWVMVPD